MPMKKVFKIFPLFSLIPALSLWLAHVISYYGSRVLYNAFNFKWFDFTTAFDRIVPIIPPFIIIYILSFAFWAFVFFYAANAGKERYYTFWTASMITYGVSLIIYLAIPTTLVRPDINPHAGPFHYLMNMIFAADAPTNLFPSMHCTASWLCYKSVWKAKTEDGKDAIPVWFQWFALIFAILICISTQVVKQHYIVDVISAIAIVELSWFFVKRFKLYVKPQAFFTAINVKLKLEKLD